MFTNKVILVTGGTKGIGKSIVLEFLKQNAKVIVLYSNDSLAADCMKEGLPERQLENLFIDRGSISDTDFLKDFFGNFLRRFGQLNVLVNNAGIKKDRLFLDMELSDWQSVIKTNVLGTLNVSLLAAEIMKMTLGPKFIVNMCSISGVFGRAGQANYACSKGAIIGMTKLFAKRFYQDSIFVNAVVPGLIRTEMTHAMVQEKVQEIISATVLRRIGEPSEIARVVLSLVSGDFSYVSGTCIKVDGGYSK